MSNKEATREPVEGMNVGDLIALIGEPISREGGAEILSGHTRVMGDASVIMGREYWMYEHYNIVIDGGRVAAVYKTGVGQTPPPVPDEHASVVLKVMHVGMFFLADSKVSVFLDGQPAGEGSMCRGIALAIQTTPGSHTLEVHALGGLRKKSYNIQLPVPGVYEAVLHYSRVWGNFKGKIDLQRLESRGEG